MQNITFRMLTEQFVEMFGNSLVEIPLYSALPIDFEFPADNLCVLKTNEARGRMYTQITKVDDELGPFVWGDGDETTDAVFSVRASLSKDLHRVELALDTAPTIIAPLKQVASRTADTVAEAAISLVESFRVIPPKGDAQQRVTNAGIRFVAEAIRGYVNAKAALGY